MLIVNGDKDIENLYKFDFKHEKVSTRFHTQLQTTDIKISNNIKTENVSNVASVSITISPFYFAVNSPYPRHSLIHLAYICCFFGNFKHKHKHSGRLPSITTFFANLPRQTDFQKCFIFQYIFN